MTDATDPLTVLASAGTTLSRTLQAIETLEAQRQFDREIAIGISSNVSVDLLSSFLRKHALLAGLRLRPHMGSHDDPVTDARQFCEQGLQAMLLLPFFDNLMPSFEDQLELLQPEQIDAKEADLRGRCRLVFEQTRSVQFVFVAAMHRFGRSVDTGSIDPVAAVLHRFNAALREEAAAFSQVRVLDTASIVDGLGRAAFDPRFYYRSTAPYAPAFLDELARRVVSSSRGFNGYYYKALVLDCDNTLWGGIVGEDLLEGIQLDPYSFPGTVYWRAQHVFASLERSGVLLCLCSKNNPDDVDEVLSRHPHAVIRDRHIAVRKVNWVDKVANLRSIATDLGIGLDSLVFLDDSAFECAAVRAALPGVRVFQVPSNLSDYPRLLHEIKELFLTGGISQESRSKTGQYRHRQQAAAGQAQFATHEEYLASLGLQVTLRRDEASSVARISELTLKSNQFNLTTLRQTPGEIRERMESPQCTVYSLTVEDRFGPSGLTGVLLATWRRDTVAIDAFLMSCRVIGRGVEFCPWLHVAHDARARGCAFIEAEFRPTAKNKQVADFYERLGLPLVEEREGVKRYRARLASFTPPPTDWIEVTQ